VTPERARELLAAVAGVTVAPAPSSPIVVQVVTAQWRDVARYARDSLGCTYFSFLTAIDWKTDGLEIVAWVDNLDAKLSVEMRSRLGADNATCPSIVPVYRGANWMERECFDMFGVRFVDHPDLRRILLADDWQGHPLLKSYAVDTPHPPYR
jgi:NADH-quinone oxidoreductase subunit C